jgi:hypothetical protein
MQRGTIQTYQATPSQQSRQQSLTSWQGTSPSQQLQATPQHSQSWIPTAAALAVVDPNSSGKEASRWMGRGLAGVRQRRRRRGSALRFFFGTRWRSQGWSGGRAQREGATGIRPRFQFGPKFLPLWAFFIFSLARWSFFSSRGRA